MSNVQIMRVTDTQVIADTMNPREDFGDLQKLADSFSVNPTFPNEPFNPPVLVRDGETYRIVDGERRIRAMRLLELESYNAIVCDDMDAANTMLAMVATDDKKQLTDLERSRGVQQALLLGVAPEKVEKSLHVRGAAKVKRGMELAGEKALSLTIDHMLALDEFAGDPERVDKILEADNNRLSNLTSSFHRIDKAQALLATLRSACEDAGVTWCETAEEFKKQKKSLEKGHVFNKAKTFYSWETGDLGEELRKVLAELENDSICVAYQGNGFNGSWEATLYAEGEKTANSKDAKRSEILKALTTLRKSWETFFSTHDLSDARFALPLKQEAMRHVIAKKLYDPSGYTNKWGEVANLWFKDKQPSEIEVSEEDASCTGFMAAALIDTWLTNCMFTENLREGFAAIYSLGEDCTNNYAFTHNIGISYNDEDKVAHAAQAWLEFIANFRNTIAAIADLGYEPQDIDFAIEDYLDQLEDILTAITAEKTSTSEDAEDAPATLNALPEDVLDESVVPFPAAA